MDCSILGFQSLYSKYRYVILIILMDIFEKKWSKRRFLCFLTT
jgi:hypothetical protein